MAGSMVGGEGGGEEAACPRSQVARMLTSERRSERKSVPFVALCNSFTASTASGATFTVIFAAGCMDAHVIRRRSRPSTGSANSAVASCTRLLPEMAFNAVPMAASWESDAKPNTRRNVSVRTPNGNDATADTPGHGNERRQGGELRFACVTSSVISHRAHAKPQANAPPPPPLRPDPHARRPPKKGGAGEVCEKGRPPPPA
jgi:hypothetical protein